MSFCRGGTACRHCAPPTSFAALYAHFHCSRLDNLVVIGLACFHHGQDYGIKDARGFQLVQDIR